MSIDLAAQGRRAYQAVETGDLADVAEYIGPEWVSREAPIEPPAARGQGPEAFAAMVRWLRTGYTDIRMVEREVVVAGSTVVSAMTMSARHTGPIVLQLERTVRVVPPTGRGFSVEHVHWTDFDSDGRALRHFARRDDLGQFTQLGVVPPTTAQLLRSVWWSVTGQSAAARRVFLRTPGSLPTDDRGAPMSG